MYVFHHPFVRVVFVERCPFSDAYLLRRTHAFVRGYSTANTGEPNSTMKYALKHLLRFKRVERLGENPSWQP